MPKEKLIILPPEEIARRRALEFLALSPTEKYDALIKLIEISNEVKEAGKALRNKKQNEKH
ncbi:MAG: hypothetical protein JWO03_356 [Bacteroidetes bacterium]|nr:hypothetical protein [Bacteroidota bacterium]